MKTPSLQLLCLICVWGLGWAPAAPAFKCTQGEDDGPNLYWPQRRVELTPADAPGQDQTSDALREAVRWGAEQWTNADAQAGSNCSDFRFVLRDKSEGEDLRAGYDWHNPKRNRNLIVYRRGADHNAQSTWFFSRAAIAMTTITYVHATGEILDADIELNDQDFRFTSCDPEEDAACTPHYDLKNTMTHELGHVLGLAHPTLNSAAVREATMYAAAPEGDLEKRDLAPDDIDGLCTIYPNDAGPGNCGGKERGEPLDLKVVPVDRGCQGVAHASWVWLLVFLPLVRRRASRWGCVSCWFPLMLVISSGCFDRTTNTWEEQPPSAPPVVSSEPTAPPQPNEESASFFSAPNIVSSPAKGRLAVVLVGVKESFSPIEKMGGTWGAASVSAAPWSSDRRTWQLLFATPVGEKAQVRDLSIEGTLENGQVVRWVKTLKIDHVIYDEDRLKVAKKYIQPPRRTRKRIQNEKHLLNQLWQIDTARRYWAGNFLRPVQSNTVTAPFGTHRIYNARRRNRHLGIDWDGKVGAPVKAAQTGRVMLAQELYYSGNTVVIDHGRGLFSLYFHLSKIEVEVGSMAYRGQLIGKVGATGQVTGPHLHFAVKLNNTYVDPGHLLSMDFSADPALQKNKVNP